MSLTRLRPLCSPAASPPRLTGIGFIPPLKLESALIIRLYVANISPTAVPGQHPLSGAELRLANGKMKPEAEVDANSVPDS